MSWQAYADQLTNQGIAKAAVYGHDGSEWAKSAGNSATGAEAQKLLQHMSSNGTSQITYGGQSFITLRNADGQVFYGKQGAGGITAAKSGKALVVGVYDQNLQPGQCNNAVENLAQYLTDNGY
mmetsp:Transcript_32297/g.55291  ORF Transcript_32297/g.55291 Transcript_32297/m.55291 type:complete len:123 (+) Transcript_32297:42-410(+)|eukprot:CAMPEP_0206153768 /NCGR_PEP_ID=MMETSP1474-20131121/868_1 /ASSEMBLY_ACC=CAM_ASM_001110 /TAXON_ID=97495 /ORGANISM="Imantonia sp., Strain RCC918" /LENGTH=122 /DNA_ID=CAMNT_0053551715 /DNA_START=23 /DNA_END=391 /DNA_ORIENTATION=-